MTQLNDGQVEIPWLDGESRHLVPTMRAIRLISREYGGMVQAVAAVSAMRFDAIAFVVRHGLSLDDKEAKDLDDTVFAVGPMALMAPCIEYLTILANGGRRAGKETTTAGEAKAGRALN